MDPYTSSVGPTSQPLIPTLQRGRLSEQHPQTMPDPPALDRSGGMAGGFGPKGRIGGSKDGPSHLRREWPAWFGLGPRPVAHSVGVNEPAVTDTAPRQFARSSQAPDLTRANAELLCCLCDAHQLHRSPPRPCSRPDTDLFCDIFR